MTESSSNSSQFLLYNNQSGNIQIDVRLEDETVWLTQAQICELFQKSKSTISEHIKNVFEEGEVEPGATVRKFRTTTPHGATAGKTQENEVNGYNLDVIISVGYRVKFPQGIQFRIWATKRLKDYTSHNKGKCLKYLLVSHSAINRSAPIDLLVGNYIR